MIIRKASEHFLEIKVKKEAPGIGTIQTFIIEKYQNSLLGGVQAEVTFNYSHGKKIEITTKQKMKEAIQAINDGANEIDMVMNIGYFKDNNYNFWCMGLISEDISEGNLDFQNNKFVFEFSFLLFLNYKCTNES